MLARARQRYGPMLARPAAIGTRCKFRPEPGPGYGSKKS